MLSALFQVMLIGLAFIGAVIVLMMVIITVRTVITEVKKALRQKTRAKKNTSGGVP